MGLGGSDLIGVWSTMLLFTESETADERLVFKNDGTGRFETYNWTLCEVFSFRWSSHAAGLVTLASCEYMFVPDGSEPQPDESLRLENEPYQITTDRSIAGRDVTALTLRVGRGMPDKFGLVQAGTAGYDDPDLARWRRA